MKKIILAAFLAFLPLAVRAAAPAPTVPDCDVCKANMAFMKAGKVQIHKLDNGMVTVVTADAKGLPGLKKAAAEMETQMKAAMEGRAKLDKNCQKMLEGMRAGKVMMGHGEIKDGFASATLSSDPDMVKGMHDMLDKMAAAKK
jgi:hypothetical protein